MNSKNANNTTEASPGVRRVIKPVLFFMAAVAVAGVIGLILFQAPAQREAKLEPVQPAVSSESESASGDAVADDANGSDQAAVTPESENPTLKALDTAGVRLDMPKVLPPLDSITGSIRGQADTLPPPEDVARERRTADPDLLPQPAQARQSRVLDQVERDLGIDRDKAEQLLNN